MVDLDVLAALQAWRLAASHWKTKGLKCLAALSHWQGRTACTMFVAWRALAQPSAGTLITADRRCKQTRR